jgi:putative transposase
MEFAKTTVQQTKQDENMIPQSELTAQDIRETMQSISQEHLPLEANGYVCTSEMLYDVLMKAASENISIDAACRDLEQSASGNRIREVLNAQLSVEQLHQYECQINEALASHLPQQLLSGRVEAAIDEHDEPCYAKRPELRAYTCRSKPKAGTGHFFRIITLYVIYRQMRLTLAVAFVRPEEKNVVIIQRLLQCAERLKVKINVLYMDRGFCSGPVINYLKAIKQRAVLACTIRGKQGGTRQLCRGRKSYQTRYTFTDGTVVDMAVVATLVPNKQGRRRRKWLLYVLIGVDWKPKTVYRRYRFRFGIEASYRSLRRVRIKTTSRNPALRFFLLGFALLLINIWALLRWFVARIPGRGPHRLDPTRFQFQAFVSMLRRAVESLYDPVMVIPIPALSMKS